MTSLAPLGKKRPWFQLLAQAYVNRRLRKVFSDVRLMNTASVTETLEKGPMIIACNHVAWWDPLLLVSLDGFLGADSYCLMDETNLKQLPFFAWLGAIPLNRENSKKSLRDLHTSESLLTGAGKVLVMFPQGEQRPAHLPLEFKRGIAILAERTKVPVLPLAIRYDYAQGPRPLVHLAAGAPLVFNQDLPHPQDQFISKLQNRVKRQLNAIDTALLEGRHEGVSLIGRKAGEHAKERLPAGSAALAALAGGSERPASADTMEEKKA